MKIAELLQEAKKIKWVSGVGNSATAEWMGHKLEVKFEKTEEHNRYAVHTGYIDGKKIKTYTDGKFGNNEKLRDMLEREVSEAPLTGTTIKSLIAHIKGTLKLKDLNDWEYQHLGAGDFMGKNKNKAFGVELDKTILAKKEDIGEKSPSTHRFVIQAFYDPSGKYEGRVDFWLAQGGQIISVGIPSINFEKDNLDSMIDALKKAVKVPDSKLIKALYKSGYHNYGRS